MAEAPKAVSSRANARPKRVPLGARNVLSFDNLDPNFEYRIINDKDDRLKRAQAAGYEFVDSDEELGDTRAGAAGSIDSHVSKPVGNGVRGYLMRIPKEFYEEDQEAKLQKIRETEAAMDPKAKNLHDKDLKGAAYGDGLSKS